MNQHLDNWIKLASQYFPNDQWLTLQNHEGVKETLELQNGVGHVWSSKPHS
jgi:hypothetical protein